MKNNLSNRLSSLASNYLQITALASLALVPAVHAGTSAKETIAPAMASGSSDSGWWWRVAPYGWVPAVTGDAGVANVEVPVDISMSDTLSDLDFAAMLTLEAGVGRWSLGLDAVYGEFSADGPGPTPALTGSKVELDEFFARGHVAYDLVQEPDFNLSLLAGVRYTYFATELSLYGSKGREFHKDASEGWFDPVIGLQAHKDLGEKWFVRFDGDIGGFGVESDLIWQAHLGFGYRFNETVSGVFGYRGFGVDYSKDGFMVDTIAHGPFVGAVFRF